MSSSNTVYLITGANRGIGLGLVTALLKRHNTTIIAGVRVVSSSSSQALLSLHTAEGSKVVLAQIDSNNQSSAELAIEGLKDIDKIDTVIANAYGISFAVDEKTKTDQVAVAS
jgi:norsolorinic acid ketoreductase